MAQGVEPHPGPVDVVVMSCNVQSPNGAWALLEHVACTTTLALTALQETRFKERELEAFRRAAKKKAFMVFYTLVVLLLMGMAADARVLASAFWSTGLCRLVLLPLSKVMSRSLLGFGLKTGLLGTVMLPLYNLKRFIRSMGCVSCLKRSWSKVVLTDVGC